MKQVLVLAAVAIVAAFGGATLLQRAGAGTGAAVRTDEAVAMQDAASTAEALRGEEAARLLRTSRPGPERREALRSAANAALAAFVGSGNVCDPAARAQFLQALGPYLIARLHDQGGLAAEAHDPRWSTAEDATLTAAVGSLADKHFLTRADLEGVIADDPYGRVLLATQGHRGGYDDPRIACRRLP